ncbi:LytTR family DNA-binding domain-containing protein [Marivirga arenosa]|uniref:LytTR family DNA-binding domain-containing protein n=1 Tax=Marivirga arenosa TaxID=3059076 RepID=A0AA51X474_9BACT|nr:LytTR family DNA-binding domain-containing protein [Marivirga sp. BKB1-2]WNB17274.1 LytTR family DNA-binding domain-containing protein [Marivirga sp. BKB1-2]
MSDFSLTKRYPWIYKLRLRLAISLVLTILVIFILLFLKPFDTGEKYLPFKNLMLAGYGMCIFIADLLLLTAERLIVFKLKKYWIFIFELLYFLSLFLLSSILVYSYDILVTKQSAITWDYLFTFSYQFILPIALLLLPLLAYVRYTKGEIISHEEIKNPEVLLLGKNQNDTLKIKLTQLIFIKAEDNYVRIVFLNEKSDVEEILMRSTLSSMKKQVKHLHYCHRSYLIAPWYIQQLKGHRQKASLVLKYYNSEIPLSGKYYTAISGLKKE